MEIGILNGQEIASALERSCSSSITHMASDIGIHDRVWRGIRNGEWRRTAQEKDMMSLLRQEAGIFWTSMADEAVAEIRNTRSRTQLHRRMELFMEQSFKALEQTGIENFRFFADDLAEGSQDIFGHFYATATYYNHMARSREAAIDRHTAAQRFAVLSDRIIEILGQRPADDLIARLLRFRVRNDQFTLKWEVSGPAERASAEWRACIVDTQFLDAMCDYNDVAPKAWQAPWNALAVASRLKMREKYADLYARILKSKPFRSIEEMRDRESYDDDFRDFDAWIETTVAIAAE